MREEGGRMRGRGEGGGDRICNQRVVSATNDNVALIRYSVYVKNYTRLCL